MADTPTGRLADLLTDTRRARLRLESIPDGARLSSVEEGIAVQSEVERRLGLPVGGWKVGIPPGAPTYRAPIYAPHVVRSPASWPGPGEGTGPTDPVIMIEGEIAFTLGRDLPPRETPYSEAEVVAAVASAHAAIEIVQWRVPGGSEGPVAERLGDHLGNEGLVVGPAQPDWQGLDRRHLHVGLEIGGRVIADKIGAKEGASDPVALLTWLANHLTQRGGLRAGEVVTTGTWSGSHAIRPGDLVVARFEGLGEARVTFG